MLEFNRLLIPCDVSDFSKRTLSACSRMFSAQTIRELHFVYVWSSPGNEVACADPRQGLEDKLRNLKAGRLAVKHVVAHSAVGSTKSGQNREVPFSREAIRVLKTNEHVIFMCIVRIHPPCVSCRLWATSESEHVCDLVRIVGEHTTLGTVDCNGTSIDPTTDPSYCGATTCAERWRSALSTQKRTDRSPSFGF